MHISKASIFFLSISLKVHVSTAYVATDQTRHLTILFFSSRFIFSVNNFLCPEILSSPSQFCSQFLSHNIHHLILNCLSTETLALAQFVDKCIVKLHCHIYCKLSVMYTSIAPIIDCPVCPSNRCSIYIGWPVSSCFRLIAEFWPLDQSRPQFWLWDWNQNFGFEAETEIKHWRPRLTKILVSGSAETDILASK